MILACGEDGSFTVHADLAEVRREWEPIDVENRVVIFYDEDGTWLKPEFTKPNRHIFFGIVLTQGEYTLMRCEQRDANVDPIEVALDEAAGVGPNPYFDSLDSLRRHLARRTGTRLEAVGSIDSGQDPDQRVLDQLREAGADLSKPTHLLFYIYAADENAARRIARAVMDGQLRAEVQPAALGGGWLCLAQGELIPALSSLKQYRVRFEELARTEGGEYDGWEAAVTR